MTTLEIWTFNTTATPTVDLTGFKVEARDGDIGKVDEATIEAGGSFIVVDTGPWIFGKKVLLPAGALTRVDLDNKKVYVRLTKYQIKSAPEFDERTYMTKDYRDRIGEHYGAMV